MSSQRETWYVIKGDELWKISENDGHAYMRRGAQRTEVLLCTVEEATTAFPTELAKAKGEQVNDSRR